VSLFAQLAVASTQQIYVAHVTIDALPYTMKYTELMSSMITYFSLFLGGVSRQVPYMTPLETHFITSGHSHTEN